MLLKNICHCPYQTNFGTEQSISVLILEFLGKIISLHFACSKSRTRCKLVPE